MQESGLLPPRLWAPEETTTVPGVELPPAQHGSLVLFLFSPAHIASFTLPDSGALIIGRARESDIPVDEPSVSRAHARLSIEPREGGEALLTVEDLGSSNGTRVNGRKIARGERAAVAIGHAIQVGNVCILTIHPAPSGGETRPIWSHGHLKERLAQAIAQGSPFTVVRVLTRGQAGVVDVLLAGLSSEDLVAVASSGDCDVLAVGIGAPLAEQRAEGVRRLLLDRGLEVGIGVASYPDDGATPEALISAAADEAKRRDVSSAKKPTLSAVVEDPRMMELHAVAERIAASDISVLILGETGAGKEVLARSIHARSPRAQGPFIPLNCGAIAPSLLESELFGYVKGAFTGAVSTRPGLLEAAERGTIFLDEVGEMPLDMQVKMLRVLEERVVWRIGGREPIPIDTRVICATHRELAALADEGMFRKDLYYRLNGITLRIPPLRERRSEIPALARKFLVDAAKSAGHPRVPSISRAALDILETAEWPGNIRQLKNAIECAFVLAGGGEIGKEHLPPLEKPQKRATPRGDRGPSSATFVDVPLKEALQQTWEDTGRITAPEPTSSTRLAAELGEIERRRIIEALTVCGGNQTRAAEMLGMSRKTLLARLDAYEIHRPRKGRSKKDE